jgi:hypothetical protein
MIKFRIESMLLMFALLFACTGLVPPLKAYDGPERDMRELSIIKATTQFSSGSTDITNFDGKTGQFGFKEIRALPGRHTMTVRVSDSPVGRVERLV